MDDTALVQRGERREERECVPAALEASTPRLGFAESGSSSSSSIARSRALFFADFVTWQMFGC